MQGAASIPERREDHITSQNRIADLVARDLAFGHVVVYDPRVSAEQMRADLTYVGVSTELLDSNFEVVDSPYAAADQAHALATLTEWDEFRELDLERTHSLMLKPAFVFDGRAILPLAKLKALGFEPFMIGKGG